MLGVEIYGRNDEILNLENEVLNKEKLYKRFDSQVELKSQKSLTKKPKKYDFNLTKPPTLSTVGV